ncbi:MAG TPA: hypothetical protein VFT72_18585 [Opitutaceae bacterium]|nr:hypothetical protein [Opitutaceae bacterium]
MTPVAEEEAPWKVGLRGARAHVLPGLALQAVAVVIGLLYYFHPASRHLMEQLSEFKARTGFLYSIAATALFGGVLPCLYLALQPETRGRFDWKQNLGLIALWAYKGVEVDLWYRFLAHTVGTNVTVGTVVTKMILDQFIYCPIWAVPFVVFIYVLIESHYDWRETLNDLRRPRWYVRRAVPNLISNMGVWIPTVCVVYSLPSTLQIPMFNLVLCFYTLLLAYISGRQRLKAEG